MGRLFKILVSPVLIPVIYALAYEAFLFFGPNLDFEPLRWFV